MRRTGVIIVAGGSGQRMKTNTPKQFLPLGGVPVLAVTLRRFLDALPDSPIVIVLPQSEMERWEDICRSERLAGTHTVCVGGSTRFESVRNGLSALEECAYVVVHDGVRPLADKELITRCIESAEKHGTAIPVVCPVDSFRTIADNNISTIVDRNCLRAVQTPQVFRRGIIEAAYRVMYSERFTDDASVVESIGVELALCEGNKRNIKITTSEDMAVAELFMRNIE